MPEAAAMKTTRAARDVITIADIEALESRPYDELIPARTLIDLLRATAHFHPDRPAITTSSRGRVFRAVRQQSRIATCIKRVVRAANLFHGLLQASGGGTVAFLGPIVEGMMEALLGAQTAGIASTINYLLSRRRHRRFAGRRERDRSCSVSLRMPTLPFGRRLRLSPSGQSR